MSVDLGITGVFRFFTRNRGQEVVDETKLEEVKIDFPEDETESQEENVETKQE